MTRAFYEIAFTEAVLAEQKKNGSAASYAKYLAPEAPRNDALGEAETEFIGERDGFYQATVNADGWPYVQYRGGAAGFLHVLDGKTLAYADFRGNRQYMSVGNLAGDDRISLFFMDYANRRRLKLFGHARIVDAQDDPQLIARLHDPVYRATPERAVVITVAGYDWNCPQHITERYTKGELAELLSPVFTEIESLKAENEALKKALAASAKGA